MKLRVRTRIFVVTMIFAVALFTSMAGAGKVCAQSQKPILGHTVIGQGPEKVIALHNFWEDQREFQPLIPYLDKCANTYAFIDLRGYHTSRNISGEYTSKEAAGDIIALADHLGWKQFHLVGHSMSGMVVQRVAVEAKNRVKSIIALTPVPAKGFKLPSQMFDDISGLVASKEGLTGYFASILPMYPKQYVMFHADRAWNNAASEVRIGYLNMWSKENFAAKAQGLETPIRVVLGSLDTGFNEAVKPFWDTFYPNCEIQICHNATHFVTEETPLFVVSAIDSFVAKHSN